MPTLPEDPPPFKAKDPSLWDANKSNIRVGNYFESKDALKAAVGVYCLQEGFECKTERSSKTRYELICGNAEQGCTWHLRAINVGDKGRAFYVNKFNPEHTCNQTKLNTNHRQASGHVVGHLVKEVIWNDHSRVYRGRDIMNDLNLKYNVDISYMQAWRGKRFAEKMLRGDQDEAFTRLPIYLHNLAMENPGTVWEIDTDGEDRFEQLYLAFGCVV